MVDAFDYNPRESSPNMDVEVSPFRNPGKAGWRLCLSRPDAYIVVSL